MHESIHGHRVLDLISQLEESVTRRELASLITRTFGSGARFHTCSRQDLTPSELLDFLFERGKLSHGEAGVQLETGRICTDE